LGLNVERGIFGVLQRQASLQNSIVPVRIRNQELLVLPCETGTLSASEWIASRAMKGLLNEIKRSFRGWTVIFDLPPLLMSDDVISLIPQLDCMLFVVGAGKTTEEEIKECGRHLEAAEVIRVVLNKAEDAAKGYYSYPMPSSTPTTHSKSSTDAASKSISKLF